MSYYRCAMREIETKFRVLDEEFFLHNEGIEVTDKMQEELFKCALLCMKLDGRMDDLRAGANI